MSQRGIQTTNIDILVEQASQQVAAEQDPLPLMANAAIHATQAGIVQQVQQIAALMRIDIVRMIAEAGSGHPGGSLSAADIMATLFFGGVLRYDPTWPTWPDRDRFILSKGHCAPVLYAALARAGFFPVEELKTLRKFGSRLQGHPDMRKLPGVEASTGSLGQGLSIAVGLAYALSLDAPPPVTAAPIPGVATAAPPPAPAYPASFRPHQVYVLLGDGECQEGQVWEAAMCAAHRRLGNLTAIIDANGLQIDGPCAQVMDLGSLDAKFTAFGWQTREVDGHNPAALLQALDPASRPPDGRPLAVVAHTVKGKGVSFMEGQAGWHGKAPTAEQAATALAEIQLSAPTGETR